MKKKSQQFANKSIEPQIIKLRANYRFEATTNCLFFSRTRVEQKIYRPKILMILNYELNLTIVQKGHHKSHDYARFSLLGRVSDIVHARRNANAIFIVPSIFNLAENSILDIFIQYKLCRILVHKCCMYNMREYVV